MTIVREYGKKFLQLKLSSCRWLTCLWQVKDGMNMGKRCSRNPGPEGRPPNVSPARKGWVYKRQTGRAPEVRQNTLRLFILRACDFFDLFVFFAPDQMLFSPLQKGVILPAPACRGSEAPHRSMHIRSFMARSRRTPAKACWQVLFGAFRPRLQGELKKSQPPTGAQRSGPVPACHGGTCCFSSLSPGAFFRSRAEPTAPPAPTQNDGRRRQFPQARDRPP